MNKFQEVLLEIALEVDRICKKHDIKYFLDSGTALGAVRHQGFIPWDDDLDIGMLREDYEKFLQVAQDELGDKYFLQTVDTDKYYNNFFAKIRKNDTEAIEPAIRKSKMHKGIWIDIFPFDYISREKVMERLKQVNELQYLYDCMLLPHPYAKPELSLEYVKKYLKHKLKRLIWPIKYGKENIKDQIFNNINKKYEDEDQVIVCYPYINPIIYFEKDIFASVKDIEFEGEKFKILDKVDKYLEQVYGDYMTIPDVEDQQTHGLLDIKF